MIQNILVTGGAGYIGSHTVLQLLLGGYKAIVVDNLDNASEVSLNRVRELALQFGNNLSFHKVDLRDKAALEKVFASTKFNAVIHFAGLKAVGESVEKPMLYYDNNLVGTINLFEVMAAHGCKNLVFSSSATVYGWPKQVPCTEEFPLSAANPYGRTKLFVEEICRDIYVSDSEWKIILLRYFNPVGAHPSGMIGEDPHGTPNNLMPFVQQVAVGRRPALTVYGTDYKTKDGTGVRDYIHVNDLADGHVAALQKLSDPKTRCDVYNLGTGKGTSVLEMVSAFEKASGQKIPLVMAGRRPGDAEIVYAATEKAHRELNWNYYLSVSGTIAASLKGKISSTVLKYQNYLNVLKNKHKQLSNRKTCYLNIVLRDVDILTEQNLALTRCVETNGTGRKSTLMGMDLRSRSRRLLIIIMVYLVPVIQSIATGNAGSTLLVPRICHGDVFKRSMSFMGP
ncbi:hypothetical protein ACFE04_006148 [Oxalis oulophora]